MENNVFLYYEVVKGLLNNIETTKTLSNSDYINLKKAYDNLINEIQSFLIYSYDYHYGYFLINLKIVYKIKKGFVMGITISPGYPVLIVNPITVGKYELKEIIYLLCHEIEHLILGHLSAIISMNPFKKQNIHQLLNIACDAAVNDQLNNEIENGLSIISCPSEAVTSETISILTNQFVIKNHHFMYYYEKLMNNENISLSLPQMSMHMDFNIDIKFGDDETSESDSKQESDEIGSEGKMSINSNTNNESNSNGSNSNEKNSSIQINLNNSTSDNGKQNSNNESSNQSKSTIDSNNCEENKQTSNLSINISNNNSFNEDSFNQQANNGGSDNNKDHSHQFQDSNSPSQSNGKEETPDLQSYGQSASNINELSNSNEQSNGYSNNNLDRSIFSDRYDNSGQLSDETQNQSEKESNNTNQKDNSGQLSDETQNQSENESNNRNQNGENNSNENQENNVGSDDQDFYDITKEDLSSDFENLVNSTDSFDDLSQLANGNYDSDSVEQIINTYIERSFNTMSQKARGLFSSKYKSVIKKIDRKPIVNWKKELRKFLGNVPLGTRKTIMRLNRRQPERIDLRGTMTDKVVKIVISIDTSGSMDSGTLSIVLNEIHKIVKDKKTEITIIECDANIHKVYKVKRINNIQYDLRGRGGTSFTPVIEYLNHKKEYRDALLIYFTDGFGEEKIPKPLIYRLLWIVIGNNLSLNKKYGKIIYINPATFKLEGKDNG